MRDDFSQRTKDLLANRVGWKCSNPNCRKATRGAGIGKENIINIGVASHITAASKGGPRYAINVIEKYYRIIGYIICDDKGVYYPIDVRKNDIAILEGTYNCIEDELKKELVPYNIKIEPAEVWSPFFFRWQFMCDWNVFETCGDFINIASKIIGNERLMKKIIDDKIDYVLPVNYKELSQMVRGLNKLFGVEFYNKDYYEEINYLFDSLVNGYHINMSTEEVETYCYQLCNYVLKRIEGEHV